MPFEDIMMKIANNKALTQSEKEELKLQSKNISNVVELSKAWQRVGENKINSSFIDFPFSIIYSKILEKDESSISIQIPTNYKNLLIMGQTRVGGSGANTVYISAQFNGDTGTNYVRSLVQQVNGGVPSSYQNLSSDKAIIGYSVGDAIVDIGEAGTFTSFIPHYRSSYYKGVLCINGIAGLNSSNMFWQSVWRNVSPITDILITPDTNTYPSALIELGSIISVYGIN